MKIENVNWKEKKSIMKFMEEGEDFEKVDGWILKMVSEELTDDVDIVKKAIETMGADEILLASGRIQDDKNMIIYALKRGDSCYLMEFLDERIRNDKEVVKVAISRDGLALQFASEELKNDWKLCMEAVRNNINAFEFVGEELKNDPQFISKVANLTHMFIATKQFNSFNEAITETMQASYSLAESDLREFMVSDMSELEKIVQQYNEEVASQTYNPAGVYVYEDENGNRVFEYTTSTAANSIIITEIVKDGQIKGYEARYEVKSVTPIEYSTSMKSFKENGWENDGKTYFMTEGYVYDSSSCHREIYGYTTINEKVLKKILDNKEKSLIEMISSEKRIPGIAFSIGFYRGEEGRIDSVYAFHTSNNVETLQILLKNHPEISEIVIKAVDSQIAEIENEQIPATTYEYNEDIYKNSTFFADKKAAVLQTLQAIKQQILDERSNQHSAEEIGEDLSEVSRTGINNDVLAAVKREKEKVHNKPGQTIVEE